MFVALTACSAPWSGTADDKGGESESGARIAPSMSALFDQYLAKDTLSRFERDVLQRARKNGKISAEDYETAHDKQISCMAERGWREPDPQTVQRALPEHRRDTRCHPPTPK